MLSLIFIQVDFSVVGLGTMQDLCIKVKIKIKMQKIINPAAYIIYFSH